jgi:hypothetical protein
MAWKTDANGIGAKPFPTNSGSLGERASRPERLPSPFIIL